MNHGPFLPNLWKLHISLVMPHFSKPGIPEILPKDLDSWLRFCHVLCPSITKKSLKSYEQVKITCMFFSRILIKILNNPPN